MGLRTYNLCIESRRPGCNKHAGPWDSQGLQLHSSHCAICICGNAAGSQFLDGDGRFPNHIPNPENAEAMAAGCEMVKV